MVEATDKLYFVAHLNVLSRHSIQWWWRGTSGKLIWLAIQIKIKHTPNALSMYQSKRSWVPKAYADLSETFCNIFFFHFLFLFLRPSLILPLPRGRFYLPMSAVLKHLIYSSNPCLYNTHIFSKLRRRRHPFQIFANQPKYSQHKHRQLF